MIPRCVLITGAAGSIGSALALEYARAGAATLILHARDAGQLTGIAAQCAQYGARVLSAGIDACDHDALMAWLQDISAAEQPDLVVANAGINIHARPGEADEDWDDMQRLLDVNIKAAMATAHAVIPAMRARGSGQVALVSSLAAWRGMPENPSYCASKAAIKVYGEALRDRLAGQGIRVNVILPGFVESKMAAAMPGPKPFQWTAQRAAAYIRKGLQADKARISFPFPLALGGFLLAGLHPAVSGWFLRRLGYD